MRTRAKKTAVSLVAVAGLTGLVACSESTGITEEDGYRIGCPAIDAVLGGGALGSKAAVAGLEKLLDQPGLSEETRQWVDTAVAALKTTNPDEMPAGAKSVLIRGCAENGYELRNLTP